MLPIETLQINLKVRISALRICPPWSEKFSNITILHWLKMLNCPPWMQICPNINTLKWLKLLLNCPPWLEMFSSILFSLLPFLFFIFFQQIFFTISRSYLRKKELFSGFSGFLRSLLPISGFSGFSGFSGSAKHPDFIFDC